MGLDNIAYGQPAIKVYYLPSVNVSCLDVRHFLHKCYYKVCVYTQNTTQQLVFIPAFTHMLADHSLCHPLCIRETEIIPPSHFIFPTWNGRDHNKIAHTSLLQHKLPY